MKHITKALTLIAAVATSLNTQAELKAFPGAEGYGQDVTGGRFGKVIHVTNLSDSGAGSLRAAIEESGARTVVFDVSGKIELESALRIVNGDLTIAGQTAPGDGICVKNYELCVDASNVIIRYMRFRLGIDRPDYGQTGNMTAEGNYIDRDAAWGRDDENIIIDHCSMSWCTDEAASFYGNKNFTMQWCIAGESLRGSLHPKGNHGYGGIWGGQGATFHHNLIINNDSRNPRLCGSRYTARPDLEKVDLRNNVFYNWGSTNSGYAGEGGSYNFVNNYYKSGPATKSSIKYRIFAPSADDGTNEQAKGVYGKFYVSGNYMEDKGENWDWDGINPNNGNNTQMTKDSLKSDTEFEVASVTTQTAAEAYADVLGYAGASYKRDAIDARLAREAKNRTYTYKGSKLGGLGIIDDPADAGGYPEYESSAAPTDTDQDGMPDEWETANGLNPNDAEDRNHTDLSADGYSNLEVYLNSLVEKVTNCTAETSTDEQKGYKTAIEDAVKDNGKVIKVSKNEISTECGGTIYIFTADSQMVKKGPSPVKISELAKGNYVATAEVNGKMAGRKFRKN